MNMRHNIMSKILLSDARCLKGRIRDLEMSFHLFQSFEGDELSPEFFLTLSKV